MLFFAFRKLRIRVNTSAKSAILIATSRNAAAVRLKGFSNEMYRMAKSRKRFGVALVV